MLPSGHFKINVKQLAYLQAVGRCLVCSMLACQNRRVTCICVLVQRHQHGLETAKLAATNSTPETFQTIESSPAQKLRRDSGSPVVDIPLNRGGLSRERRWSHVSRIRDWGWQTLLDFADLQHHHRSSLSTPSTTPQLPQKWPQYVHPVN